jgi:hypothetical protein
VSRLRSLGFVCSYGSEPWRAGLIYGAPPALNMAWPSVAPELGGRKKGTPAGVPVLRRGKNAGKMPALREEPIGSSAFPRDAVNHMEGRPRHAVPLREKGRSPVGDRLTAHAPERDFPGMSQKVPCPIPALMNSCKDFVRFGPAGSTWSVRNARPSRVPALWCCTWRR